MCPKSLSSIDSFVLIEVSVANSDDLTTRDDTKRRIIYRRFSQKVADLYYSQTIHSLSWILDPDISSRVNNIYRLIHKRSWNIRSSMTQNVELQEHLETFTWIFRHIRSRISENETQISYLRFFHTPTFYANPVIPDETWSRWTASKVTTIDSSSSLSNLRLQGASAKSVSLSYNCTMSNSVVKCVQLYVISKMMNFKDVLSVILLFASCEGRHCRTCTLELETINVERVNVFSVLTFSLSKLRHMLLHLLKFLKDSDEKEYDLGKKKSRHLASFLKFRWKRGKKKKKADRHVITNIQRLQSPRSILNRNDQKTQTYTHTKTLSRLTLRRREQIQYCTNFNSSHARRTLTAHMDSARATLEWRDYVYVDPRWITEHESWQTCLWLQKHEQWKYILCHLHFQEKLWRRLATDACFCHKMNVWARKIVTCSWDRLYDKNHLMKSVSILLKWSCSRA